MFFAACSKEKYTLEYKLAKGETYKINVLTDLTMNQEMMDQDMKIAILMDMKMHYDVTDVQANLITMNLMYDAVSMDMDMDMGAMGATKMSFNSNTEETVATSENMSAMFKAMTGIPVEMKISKQGKVESVSGFDKIFTTMLATFAEDVDEQVKIQTEEMLKQQFNNESAKSMFQQISAYFPEKPIGIGEDWKVSMDIKTGQFSLKSDMDMTLKSVEENIATLEVSGSISTPEDGIVQEIQGMETKTSMKGTQQGTIKIDINTGWPVNSEISQNLEGKTEVMGIKIPLTYVSKITMKN
jgi:hypothetical protein